MLTDKEVLDELNINYSDEFNNIKHLRTGGSNSYEVMCEYERYFLRVISDAFNDTIKDSINVHLYLIEHGFNVPKIVLNKSNEPFGTILLENKRYTYVLYEFIEGAEPEQGESIEEMGELTGKLHKIMSGYTGKLKSRDKNFFIQRYLNILERKGYSKVKYMKFEEYGEELWERVKHLPVCFAHGDLHRGNLIKSTDGKLYFIDFDS